MIRFLRGIAFSLARLSYRLTGYPRYLPVWRHTNTGGWEHVIVDQAAETAEQSRE